MCGFCEHKSVCVCFMAMRNIQNISLHMHMGKNDRSLHAAEARRADSRVLDLFFFCFLCGSLLYIFSFVIYRIFDPNTFFFILYVCFRVVECTCIENVYFRFELFRRKKYKLNLHRISWQHRAQVLYIRFIRIDKVKNECACKLP